VPRSRFAEGLAAVAAVAAGIQILFVHALSHPSALPAAAGYDTVQARLLVRGWWFVDPVQATAGAHLLVPTAVHPPLPTALLAIADVADATGPTSHRVFLALLFVASVVLAGVTVRNLVGERAGLLAALVIATFPLLWVNPATLGPETAVIAVTTLLLLAAVRFWSRPTMAHAALVGLSLGLAALTRTDLVALVVLVGLPLGLLVKHTSWTVKARGLAVMGILFLLVVGPWVGRNLSLFGSTVVLSQDYGPAVAGANCGEAYSGALEGWWSTGCVSAVRTGGPQRPSTPGDQVRAGWSYASRHRGAVIEVAAARLGREWSVYRPGQTASLEVGAGRPTWVSNWGQWYLYGLAPVALLGAVVLRRRRLLLFPFVVLILLSSLTAVLAFGDPRFAVEGEVALGLLAGVALDAVIGRVTRRWSSGTGRHSAGRRANTS
jgi:Dolichyl-phosphate-mannose-protein mannosyltransferase